MSPNPENFVHLHLHTQYSLLDGAIQPDRLFKRANEYGMTSVAITDHGTMFGVLDFYQRAQNAGIKPIIGCECYVAPRTIHHKTPDDRKGATHLILLAKNMQGYKSLCKLATIAQLEGFYNRPRVDKALLREHHEGLIAMSACLKGEVPGHIRNNRIEAADAAALEFVEIFGEDHFFLEVQSNGIPAQDRVNQGLLEMHQRLSIPLVASNDCHYLDEKDVKAHNILLCIQTNKTIHDESRFQFTTEELFFKPGERMISELGEFPEAVENTKFIADRCEVDFEFGKYHFPKYETPSKKPVTEVFEEMTRTGFQKIMARIRKQHPDVDEAVYKKRLDYEIGVINEMGFAGYFLIVADFIRFARENDVPVGPGRGSAAGSLVAYSLGITGLDPLAHGLLFERFLNPGRKSMPDIDVDFCINGREKVYEYVVQKYGGGEYVAQIITYGKMKARAVIRDVARAMAIPLAEADAIAKLVPDVIDITIADAVIKEPRLKARVDEDPNIAELLSICRTLEGLTRHASTHAAGVVISDKPLVEYLPLYRGKKEEVVTQFDMNCVEKIGLVKFDFLGLRNLTVIDNTLKLLEKQGRRVPDPDQLDMDDAKTYALLAAADTTGVFQLESAGMKNLLARMKPERFDDIIALVALYRPGLLDSHMDKEYVERKQGRKKIAFLVPELEPILNNTYGVAVYQEQVMQIVVDLAGYTMAEADDFRKAMGKKKMEIIDANTSKFINGAIKNGIPENKARELFELVKKFGRYGFNKSHSAAYALIAYQTAWLKTHHPVEFLAALLTGEMNSTDGVVKYISECRDHQIDVLPPDINRSDKVFTVSDGRIRFGLLAVKNVGGAAIDAMIEAREEEGGDFTSLFDFYERVDAARINKRMVECLIKCGAFDCLGEPRARLMAGLEDAVDFGLRAQRRKNDPQMSLFDMGGKQRTPLNYPKLPQIDEWDKQEKLAIERDMLGFYLTGHPLERFRDTLERFSDNDIAGLNKKKDGEFIRVGGIIKETKNITTKKGDPMAFVQLEDHAGKLEVVVFPRVFQETSQLLTANTPVFVQGKLQKEEGSLKILADAVVSMETADAHWTASIEIMLNLETATPEMLSDIKQIFENNPGKAHVMFRMKHPNTTVATIKPSERFRVNPNSGFRRKIRGCLGYDAVETICTPIESSSKPQQQYRGNNGNGPGKPRTR